MEHDLEVLASADEAAQRGAELIAESAKDAIAERGSFALAASGGTDPWNMYRRLADQEIDWDQVEIFQVDERVAPDGDDARNLTHLLESLPAPARARVRPMPVTDDDLDAAAERYAELLPERLALLLTGDKPEDPPRAFELGIGQGHAAVALVLPGHRHPAV